MGVRNASSGNTTILAASPANGVETVILTTGIIGLVYDNAQVLILWMCNITVGAAATGVQFKLRKGALVSGAALTLNDLDNVTASTTVVRSGMYTDLPGISAGVQYSLTVQVQGGAVAGTVVDASIFAMVL